MTQHNLAKSIDVLGISCPVNAVRVKAAIAELESQELLEVFCDEGEALLRISQSLKDAGHRIIKAERRDRTIVLIVRKS